MRQFLLMVICLLIVSCQHAIIAEKPTKVLMISNDTVLKVETHLNRNTGVLSHKQKPFSGITISHYENGNVSEAIHYLEGRKSGWYRKWFADGLLSFESFYQNGKKHGTTKSWWSNGNLRSESYHVNGVMNGVQKKWYNTGERFKETSVVNGVVEGMQKAWRKNGKLYANFEVKNGRTFGLQRANLCYQLKDEQVQIKP